MHMRFSIVLGSFFVLAGCSSSSEEASAGGSTPADAQSVAWKGDGALSADGTAPALTAKAVCGSDTATFLSELTSGSLAEATVNQEWADAIAGGKQIAVSGVVKTTHLGPQDMPMSHQLGDDLSMNVELDADYVPFAQHLGTEAGEEGPNQLHVEISSGYIPHVPTAPSPDTGQTWEQMTDMNRKSFQPGFDIPPLEDRILIQGRYIVDCGHANFSTELHAMSFLAWSDVAGAATKVHLYYNPFRDTERYNPDFPLLGRTGDASRFASSDTKPFPGYFAAEVVRLITNQVPRLRSYGLIDAQQVSPPDWVVCAPAGTSGSQLELHYDFVTRNGVTVTAEPDSKGCVTMHTVIGESYSPSDIPLRRCELPWAYLNMIAGAAVGDPTLDIRVLIENQVGTQYKDKIDQDPEIACGDALAGPPVTDTPTDRSIRVDDTQPFPFYGVITVGWKK